MKVTIDGQSVEVEPGTTILNAARMIGGDVVPPAMCYYSKLKGSGGKCRCCLVEVSKGSDANPTPMPKLVASCCTTVMDGMEVKSIKKKMKDKAFAASVCRDNIRQCAEAGLELDEFLALSIEAMRTHSAELGLSK